MTPAQMLARIKKPEPVVQQCELPPTEVTLPKLMVMTTSVLDFAAASNLTTHQCLDKKLCPICGARMSRELDTANNRLEYFWCDKTHMHAFERDLESGIADRVPM